MPNSVASRRCPLFVLLRSTTAAALLVQMLLLLDCQNDVRALILSGGPESFARYPKWAQTFENELSFEFKTRQSNALLLYTDDGAVQHNFFTISILESRVQLEFRLGEPQLDPVERRLLIQISLPETMVDDGKWHKFNFFQAWENVKVQLDEETVFRVLDQRSFSLGNIRTNSDVFIGGIPKEVEKLSSPLRRHPRRFAGSIRNLFYRIYPQGMSTPQLMDSLGTRKTDEDYCQPGAGLKLAQHGHHIGQVMLGGYCQNEGLCYSANNGPRCDCSFSDFEGRRCEIKKPSTEVSFFGNEWLGYDLRGVPDENGNRSSTNTIASSKDMLAVWSRQEVYNITFRTNFSSALIFLAGDSRNHVKLLLEKGVILAHSQLADTEKRIIRVQDRSRRRVHLDDGFWHSVCLIRELNSPGLKSAVFSMRLIVDDFFDQNVRQFAHEPWLGNAFFFLGGVPHAFASMVPEHLFPFRGCIKKAFFQSGPIQLNMIQLADQGFGQSSVQTYGDLSYSCSPNAQVPEVFSFNTGQNYTKLPAWRSPARGTLAFQFRTLLSEGLILYHGMSNCRNFTVCDYLAFELVDGHLMMIINLGSGDIRLQASANTMNDGHWHSVVMERSGRREEPIFLGAVPWPNAFMPRHQDLVETVTVIELVEREQEPEMQFPSSIWTIGLRLGFIGCLKNIRVNGINAEIAHAFRSTLNTTASVRKSREPISAGCPFSFAADYCVKPGAKNPCKNDGICTSLHNSFRCDCANSIFEGPTCQQKPRPVPLPLPFPLLAKFTLSRGWQSESEDLELKFRLRLGLNGEQPTTNHQGLFILMDTKAVNGHGDRLLLAVMASGGLLVDWVFGSGEEKIFHWASNSSLDEHWHSAKVRRRGRSIGLFFDGHWSHHTLQAQNPAISIEELAIGQPIGAHRVKEKPEHMFRFHGDLRHFTLNGHDLLKPIRGRRQSANSRQQKTAASPEPTSSSAEQIHWKTSTAKKEQMDEDAFGEPWKLSAHHENDGHGKAYELYPPQTEHQQKWSTGGDFSTPTTIPPYPAPFYANDSFFTKAPLGCLRQSATQSCEPEPTPEDSFFTPIVSKPFHRATPPTTPSTTKTTTQKTTSTASSTTPSSTRKPTVPTTSPSVVTTKSTKITAAPQTTPPTPRIFTPKAKPAENTSKSTSKSEKMSASPEPPQPQRQRVKSAEQQRPKGYYEPAGGWPMRTRTWPDGRRLGPDGVRKWQKLRPKMVEKTKETEKMTKTTETTTRSWSSTRRTTPTSSSSTSRTTSGAETTQRLMTVDPSVRPGLHFTFAPTTTRKPPTSSSSTLAPRFPVLPDDPTLYAVRPTTPMNGAYSQNVPPTSIGPPTSTNQLGDDKKYLIGVGSLSIVVMVGAILLCVFCKRCNQICSQMAAAVGAHPPVQQPPGFKAGYTPIPPNEFASPQMQHHQMQNFESNGTRATVVGPTTSLLRNGGGSIGNGISTAVGLTEHAQTRVVLANGNGGLRETISLVNASATSARDAQRKREFKEWYV